MVRYRVVQILLLVNSMAFQVIHSMMPEDINKSPSQETSHINSMPFQVEGIAKIIDQLPKELRYKIISYMLELRVNKKYEVYKKFDVGSYVNGIALTADNTRALVGSGDEIARIWDVEKGTVIIELRGDAGGIPSVALSADGTLALTGSRDTTPRVWNTLTGKLLKTLQVGSQVDSVALSADGTLALTGSFDGTARLYNTSTGALLKELKGCTSAVSVALSADGTLALTGSFRDSTPRVWNTLTGELLKTLQLDSWVTSVALSADGTTALIGAGKKVLVWDVKSGTLLNTLLTTGSVISVALSKDGKRALVGTRDNKIQVWNTKPLPGQKETNIPLTVLEGHTNQVKAVAFGGDDFIASGSDDNTVLIWKSFTPQNHYWPLKEGKLDWKALNQQEMAAWEVYIEIFYKPKYALLHESISCGEKKNESAKIPVAQLIHPTDMNKQSVKDCTLKKNEPSSKPPVNDHKLMPDSQPITPIYAHKLSAPECSIL